MKREWLVSLVLGLILLVGGGWLLVYELQHPPASPEKAHSGHIYVFVGIALLGALLINPTPNKPSPLMAVIKSVVIVVQPIIPWSKVAAARRASTEVSAVKPDEPGPTGG